MAFSAVTERGSNSTKVSGTTVAVSPSANLTVGKIVFAVLTANNVQTTDGASTDHSSITDTDGHTWTKVFERTNSAGIAADGVAGSLWWTLVTSQIGTGDSITGTVGIALLARVIGVFEVTIGAGQTIQLVGSAFLEDDTNTPAGLVISGLPSKEYLFLGLSSNETAQLTWTEDADYTNVFAAEGIGTTGSGDATNVSVNVAYRIATLTGDTFSVAGLTGATQHTLALLAFEEVSTGGAATVTPAVIAISASLPTAGITAGAVVTPAVIPATAALPLPTAQGQARTTPAVIPVTASLLTPAVLAAAAVTPAVIPVTVGLPIPTINVAGGPTTVTPAVIAATVLLPTPAILAAARVTPAVIPITVSLPTPTINVAGGPVVATPAVIAVTVNLPPPAILAAARVNPSTIAVLVSLPTPALLGGGSVSPDTILLTVTLPTPVVIVGVIIVPRRQEGGLTINRQEGAFV